MQPTPRLLEPQGPMDRGFCYICAVSLVPQESSCSWSKEEVAVMRERLLWRSRSIFARARLVVSAKPTSIG
eukprot:scaffold244995_cov32-Tisochrysis_lutea.AAC.1